MGLPGGGGGPATEMMLDLAKVDAGSRVLDVGAGTGESTLVAAQRVGPNGRVLATDIAASVLEIDAASSRAGIRTVTSDTSASGEGSPLSSRSRVLHGFHGSSKMNGQASEPRIIRLEINADIKFNAASRVISEDSLAR